MASFGDGIDWVTSRPADPYWMPFKRRFFKSFLGKCSAKGPRHKFPWQAKRKDFGSLDNFVVLIVFPYEYQCKFLSNFFLNFFKIFFSLPPNFYPIPATSRYKE
jgi:hypothetical protein